MCPTVPRRSRDYRTRVHSPIEARLEVLASAPAGWVTVASWSGPEAAANARAALKRFRLAESEVRS